jgi:TRAP-type C4-dicarboxylate transport system substrate-binding protein
MRRFGLFFLVMNVLLIWMSVNFLQAAPPVKPLVLKAATWTPAHIPHGRAGMWLVQDVEKRSQGRIKIEYYWSNSLVPAKQLVDALQKGVADIAFINPAYQPGKLPLMTVNTLPATSPGEYYPTAKAFQELMQMPEMEAEIGKLNIQYLGPLTNTTYGVWTSKKHVHHVEDLKGLKIRAIGLQANLLDALGGVPVSLGATEIYQAIAKGTLDGGGANAPMAIGYKWEEVAKYYYTIPLGNMAMILGVNKDSWEKIPPDIQDRFRAVHDVALGAAHDLYQGEGEVMLNKMVAAGKVIVTEPSPEDLAKVRKAAKEKIWSDWVKKMEKKGLPGQKVLDRWLELLAKWHGTSPFK